MGPGDVSFSDPGDSVSDDVSFMKQIWRFIPAQDKCIFVIYRYNHEK